MLICDSRADIHLTDCSLDQFFLIHQVKIILDDIFGGAGRIVRGITVGNSCDHGNLRIFIRRITDKKGMVGTILVFFCRTCLSRNIDSLIIIIAFGFNHLSHALMDGIPPCRVQIYGISYLCAAFFEQDPAVVRNMVHQC